MARQAAQSGKPVSAGVLVWERGEGGLRVLLAHMGGPFWAHKDAGAWTIPKGLLEPDESPLAGARREFMEETGIILPEDDSFYADLGNAPGPGNRKILHIYALPAEHVTSAGCESLNDDAPASNTFALEWPPGSGQVQEFPEIDRLRCMPLPEAMEKITPTQRVFLQRLLQMAEHRTTLT